MKPQDIVILLKLLSQEQQMAVPYGSDPYALRSLEASLGISKSEISASLKRSIAAGLATKTPERITVNRRNLVEFVLHGLKYVFPAKPGAPERGVPTGFVAPMLKGDIVSAGEDSHVWPFADGVARGVAVEPLFKSVPEAALKDERLYEYLALIDALRLGRPREANLAKDKLAVRLAEV
jgi:DNA-binding MarR family transcriptional regulator